MLLCHGISQARILEWVTISFSRGSSWPRDQTQVSCIPGRRFSLWATRACLVTKTCLTLCDPMDASGSSVHGISQARILEWVAISYSRGSSQSRNWTCVSCIGRWILYTIVPPGKPTYKGESYRCCEEKLIEIEKRGQRNFSWSGRERPLLWGDVCIKT